MRIAIDAMGGDDGPRSIVDGALVAARHLQIGLLLVGASTDIERELSRHPRVSALDVRILDTPESIGMGESAGTALRQQAARVRSGWLRTPSGTGRRPRSSAPVTLAHR